MDAIMVAIIEITLLFDVLDILDQSAANELSNNDKLYYI
jgi:hypothetical protein